MTRLERQYLEEELYEAIGENEETIMRICDVVEKWEQYRGLERKERQKEGIKKAREKGVTFGRPRLEEPKNFEKICNRVLSRELSAILAAEACGMGLSTFYRRINRYKEELGKRGEENEGLREEGDGKEHRED